MFYLLSLKASNRPKHWRWVVPRLFISSPLLLTRHTFKVYQHISWIPETPLRCLVRYPQWSYFSSVHVQQIAMGEIRYNDGTQKLGGRGHEGTIIWWRVGVMKEGVGGDRRDARQRDDGKATAADGPEDKDGVTDKESKQEWEGGSKRWPGGVGPRPQRWIK